MSSMDFGKVEKQRTVLNNVKVKLKTVFSEKQC